MGDVVEFKSPHCKTDTLIVDVLRDAAQSCERGMLIMGYTSDLDLYFVSVELEDEDILEMIKMLRKSIRDNKAKKDKSQPVDVTG